MLHKTLGISEVDFVDNNSERIELAHSLKADNVYTSFSQVTKKYDLVIDAC